MRQAMPFSLLFFAVAALWVGLQAVPVLGIILLFILAPLWSIAFINAGFIGIGAEAITGRVSLYWLALPAVWFGGYLLFAINDYQALRALRSEIASSNASIRIPFDPAKQALVFKGDQAQTDLIDNYAIPIVYGENPNFQGFSHLSYRMIDNDACTAIRDGTVARRAGIDVFGFHDPSGNAIGDSVFEQRFCNLQQPEDPALPVVLVETKETEATAGPLPVTLTTTMVTLPDGKTYAIKGGVASTLFWFPMPVIGCWQWERSNCGAEFWRKSFVPLVSKPFRYAPDPSLAKALGLMPVKAEDRVAVDAGATMQMVETKRQVVVTQELAVLDAVIRDVTTEADSLPFRSLSGQTRLLLPRLPGMVAAVERGVNGSKGRNNAQQVFDLIRSMPRRDVARYKDRLEALWLKDSWFEYDQDSERGQPLPERCKTATQRGMDGQALERDMAERRNHPIDDAGLISAYRDPDCHPKDAFGNSVLGLHNGATVKLDKRNGHVVVFYTPGTREVFDGRNGYRGEWLKEQSCQSVRGIEMVFGPTKLCAPAAVAPMLAAEAAKIAQLR